MELLSPESTIISSLFVFKICFCNRLYVFPFYLLTICHPLDILMLWQRLVQVLHVNAIVLLYNMFNVIYCVF